MQNTRRSFLGKAVRGLLAAGAGAAVLKQPLRAQGMDDAMPVLVNAWNQYGVAGMNWTSDPNAAPIIVGAYNAAASAWASDGTDDQLLQAVSEGGQFEFAVYWLGYEIPLRALGELYQNAAQVSFSDVIAWYNNPGVDWYAAQNMLQSMPLSALTASLASALSNPSMAAADIQALVPPVLLGSGLADFLALEAWNFGTTSAGAGALAGALANMALV